MEWNLWHCLLGHLLTERGVFAGRSSRRNGGQGDRSAEASFHLHGGAQRYLRTFHYTLQSHVLVLPFKLPLFRGIPQEPSFYLWVARHLLCGKEVPRIRRVALHLQEAMERIVPCCWRIYRQVPEGECGFVDEVRS